MVSQTLTAAAGRAATCGRTHPQPDDAGRAARVSVLANAAARGDRTGTGAAPRGFASRKPIAWRGLGGSAGRLGGEPVTEIEVVYVTVSRKDERDGAPKRRVLPYRLGDPLPRMGESVIVDFDEGAPTRWIVQDIVHVLDGDRHGIVVKLAAPFSS